MTVNVYYNKDGVQSDSIENVTQIRDTKETYLVWYDGYVLQVPKASRYIEVLTDKNKVN